MNNRDPAEYGVSFIVDKLAHVYLCSKVMARSSTYRLSVTVSSPGSLTRTLWPLRAPKEKKKGGEKKKKKRKRRKRRSWPAPLCARPFSKINDGAAGLCIWSGYTSPSFPGEWLNGLECCPRSSHRRQSWFQVAVSFTSSFSLFRPRAIAR